MAPLPDAANCILVRLSGTIQNGRWSNTFHLQYSGTAPQVADLTTLANGIAAAWTTNVAPLIPSTTALTGLVLADLTNRASAQANVPITAVPGTRTGTANTNSAACVVSWPINHRYRGGHPRTYLPAGVQADVSGGSQWTTTFKNLVQTNMAAFRTALNGLTTGTTTYKMIALSYHFNKQPLNPPVAYTVAAPVVHGRVDTARLRLGKETP